MVPNSEFANSLYSPYPEFKVFPHKLSDLAAKSNTNEPTMGHVRSQHMLQVVEYVDLGAAGKVFWTHFALYLLTPSNDSFTFYIDFKMS